MEGEQSNGGRKKQSGKVEERMEYVSVKFDGNGSKKWDGKEVEVPGKTVVKLGEVTAEGLERAEVHWPGKGGETKDKVWKCVILPDPEDLEETADPEDSTSSAAPAKKRSRGKLALEKDLAHLERQRTARELTETEPPPHA